MLQVSVIKIFILSIISFCDDIVLINLYKCSFWTKILFAEPNKRLPEYV